MKAGTNIKAPDGIFFCLSASSHSSPGATALYSVGGKMNMITQRSQIEKHLKSELIKINACQNNDCVSFKWFHVDFSKLFLKSFCNHLRGHQFRA